jgi:hypothetical protein
MELVLHHWELYQRETAGGVSIADRLNLDRTAWRKIVTTPIFVVRCRYNAGQPYASVSGSSGLVAHDHAGGCVGMCGLTEERYLPSPSMNISRKSPQQLALNIFYLASMAARRTPSALASISWVMPASRRRNRSREAT